jgi:uncharacterized protein YjiS (DUF1127 family)
MNHRHDKASRARRQINRLRERERELLEVLLSCRSAVKGSVYELKTRCGKPTCSCVQGALHGAMVLSWSQAGKTKLMTIGAADLQRLVRMTAEYRKFRQARAALVKLQKELLREVDRLGGAIREAPVKSGGG